MTAFSAVACPSPKLPCVWSLSPASTAALPPMSPLTKVTLSLSVLPGTALNRLASKPGSSLSLVLKLSLTLCALVCATTAPTAPGTHPPLLPLRTIPAAHPRAPWASSVDMLSSVPLRLASPIFPATFSLITETALPMPALMRLSPRLPPWASVLLSEVVSVLTTACPTFSLTLSVVPTPVALRPEAARAVLTTMLAIPPLREFSPAFRALLRLPVWMPALMTAPA